MTTSRPRCYLALAALGTLAVPTPTRACGLWHLEDDERGRTVTFYVVSMEGVRRGGDASKKQRLGWFNHQKPKVCQRGETKLAVRDGRFLFGDTVQALLDGSTLQVDKRKYEIAVTPAERRPEDSDFMAALYGWQVEVRSGGKSVARGRAMSFASCSRSDREAQQAEIRERVACYLTLSNRRR